MTKVEIDSENVLKAYREGCSDVKGVLENLFPNVAGVGFNPKIGQIYSTAGGMYLIVIISEMSGDFVKGRYIHWCSDSQEGRTFNQNKDKMVLVADSIKDLVLKVMNKQLVMPA